MSFGALLNDTCTIYERVKSTDADTGEQIYVLSAVAENVACAFQNGGGSLDRNSRLITGTNSDRLYLFPPEFELKKTVHVLEVRGVQYRIVEMKDLGGRGRYMRLDLERTALNE